MKLQINDLVRLDLKYGGITGHVIADNGGFITITDEKGQHHTVSEHQLTKLYNGSFRDGQYVIKTGGDYKFCGFIVSIFRKSTGHTRIVVEDARGLLFIFNPSQLDVCTENDYKNFSK